MTSALLAMLLCLPLLLALIVTRALLTRSLPTPLRRLFVSASTAGSSSPVLVSSSGPCRVLVVGGSFAGLTFCRELLHRLPVSSGAVASRVSVTLVEPRLWFEYTPGVLRALVRPSHHAALLTDISDTALVRDARFEHVQGVCAALSDRAALVSEAGQAGDGHWLPFDYCVLALGSGYSEHIKQRDTTTTTATDTAAGDANQPIHPQQQQQQKKAAAADGLSHQPTADSSPVLLAAPVLSDAAKSAQQHTTSPVPPFCSSAPTKAQRRSALLSVHSALQASEEVHIVGAGLVGVVSSPRPRPRPRPRARTSALVLARSTALCSRARADDMIVSDIVRRCLLCRVSLGVGG